MDVEVLHGQAFPLEVYPGCHSSLLQVGFLFQELDLELDSSCLLLGLCYHCGNVYLNSMRASSLDSRTMMRGDHPSSVDSFLASTRPAVWSLGKSEMLAS